MCWRIEPENKMCPCTAAINQLFISPHLLCLLNLISVFCCSSLTFCSQAASLSIPSLSPQSPFSYPFLSLSSCLELSHAWGNWTEHYGPTWQPPAVRWYTCVYVCVCCVYKEKDYRWWIQWSMSVHNHPTPTTGWMIPFCDFFFIIWELHTHSKALHTVHTYTSQARTHIYKYI